MAGKEKKSKISQDPPAVGTQKQQAEAAATDTVSAGKRKSVTRKGKGRGRGRPPVNPTEEASDASELDSSLSVEDNLQADIKVEVATPTKTPKSNAKASDDDGENTETPTSKIDTPRTMKTRTPRREIAKKSNVLMVKKTLGKRKRLPGRKMRGRPARRHSDGRLELGKVDDSFLTRSDSPRSDAQFRMLRNGKPRSDSPEPKKRRRLLLDSREKQEDEKLKPEAKIIKIDPKEVVSDSECTRRRRRSDSLSKCSDTTDTSSFYDQPPKLLPEVTNIKLTQEPTDCDKSVELGDTYNNNKIEGNSVSPITQIKIEPDLESVGDNSTSDKIPEKFKILDKMAQTFNDSGLGESDSGIGKIVRRSMRQRKSTLKEREGAVTPKLSDETVESIELVSKVKQEELKVDTELAKSPSPPILEKASSISPEIKNQGVSHIHVKQFYGELSSFMENNVGIESDPQLSEIITETAVIPLLEKENMVSIEDISDSQKENVKPMEELLPPVLELQVEEKVKEEEFANNIINILEGNSAITLIKESKEENVFLKHVSNENSVSIVQKSGNEISLEEIVNPIMLQEIKEIQIELESKVDEPDVKQVVDKVKEANSEKVDDIISTEDKAMDIDEIDAVTEEKLLRSPVESMEVQESTPEEIIKVNKEESISDVVVAGGSENTEVTDFGETLNDSFSDVPVEDQLEKENIMTALGLLTHKAADQAKIDKQKRREQIYLNNKDAGKLANKSDNYTGTLKTVIKLHRGNPEKRKGRYPLKMTIQKGRGKYSDGDGLGGVEKGSGSGIAEDLYYTIHNEMDEVSSGIITKDNALHGGNNRKSHYRSLSYDSSIPVMSDINPLAAAIPPEPGKALVIPEKASSFSIHPGRLCRDQCFYCGGKFGLFDTPCHVAQIKSVERQRKILDNEEKLTVDNCLCDACYRHVDRRANCPSYRKRSNGPNASFSHLQESHDNNSDTQSGIGTHSNDEKIIHRCYVANCEENASNTLRRKWLMKMRKTIAKVVRVEFDNLNLSSIPLCENHYNGISDLMVCSLCKRRLARNHINYIGQESVRLEGLLQAEGIPAELGSTPVICKLCRYFSNILLKPTERKSSSETFFKNYRNRLLLYHNIEVTEESENEEETALDKEQLTDNKKTKSNKTKKLNRRSTENQNMDTDTQNDISNNMHPSKENDEDIENIITKNTIIPLKNKLEMQQIATNCSQNNIVQDPNKSTKKINKSMLLSKQNNNVNKKLILDQILSQQSSESSVSHLHLQNHKTDKVKQLRANPSISVRELFPGEEEMGLIANVPLSWNGPKTPEGWTKCTTTIQYDESTRQLWNELQKPYGNQSSFLRHLILLEKHFRNGDLVLSPSATFNAINYAESAQNRLRSFDNLPTNGIDPSATNKVPKTSTKSVEITAKLKPMDKLMAPPPVPVSKQSSEEQVSILKSLQTFVKPQEVKKPLKTEIAKRPTSLPPELISIAPKPSTSSVQKKINTSAAKVPEPTKKPRPAGSKPWRPTLIPIVPGSEPPSMTQLFQTVDGRRLPSLVQVMSGGKPYHISIQDYNRMCILRREKFAQMQKNQLQKVVHKDGISKLSDSLALNASANLNAPSPSTQVPKKPVDIPNKLLEQNSLIPIKPAPEKQSAKRNLQTSLLKTLPVANKNVTITSKNSTLTTQILTNSFQQKPLEFPQNSGVTIVNEDLPNTLWSWQNFKGKRLSEPNEKVESVLSKIPKSLTIIPQKSSSRTNSLSPSANVPEENH